MMILAKNAGFCFGVKRAVDAVEKNLDKNIVTLGPLIHNENVIQSLEARGVRCVDSLDEVDEGETVVIRSHGVGALGICGAGKNAVCRILMRRVRLLNGYMKEFMMPKKVGRRSSLWGKKGIRR